MKAGQKDRWKPLQLLVFFSLLILTKEFEVREEDGQEEDSAALHHLRGTSEHEFPAGLTTSSGSSLTSDLLLKLNEDSGSFLVHLENQMKDQVSLSPSQISHEFRHKLLLRENSSHEFSVSPKSIRVRSLYRESCESEEDSKTEVKTSGSGSDQVSGLSGSSFTNLMVKPPQEAAAVFSPDGKTNTDFIQGLKIHDLEAGSETNHQPDSGSWFRTGPTSQFDHQQILMLQDDDVVRSAAAALYDKDPSLSSLHLLDNNQRPQQVKGQRLPLSENSSLVLVGHGARDASGHMRVSGLTYRDLARILQSCSRISPQIRTTTVVACEVGSDQAFIENLLKELHEAGIQTQLHLWTTVVQVTESGKILSQEASPDGPQWRHRDDTKRVVVTIGRNGEVRRRNGSQGEGEAVFTNNTNFLQPPQINDKVQNFISCWPDKPTSFIDPKVYEKVDQNHLDQVKKDFKILDSLTWGLFHPNQPNPVKFNNAEFNNNNFIIGEKDEKDQLKWINDATKKQQVLDNCYVVGSGRDIRNIIRRYAKDGETKTTYLMVNNWIFSVEPKRLYVHPAGKRLADRENQADIKIIINSCYETQNHKAVETYDDIRGRLADREKNGFIFNVEQIFKGEAVSSTGIGMCGYWYFTASVIAESARNFRTFPLTLMALSMKDKNFWFDTNSDGKTQPLTHPMARGGSWTDQTRRGFCGSAAPEGTDLADLLRRENKMFRKWEETYKDMNKLTRMIDIAVEYKVLEEAEKETFKQECINFMNTSGGQLSGSGGQPSGSGGQPSGSGGQPSGSGGSKV